MLQRKDRAFSAKGHRRWASRLLVSLLCLLLLLGPSYGRASRAGVPSGAVAVEGKKHRRGWVYLLGGAVLLGAGAALYLLSSPGKKQTPHEPRPIKVKVKLEDAYKNFPSITRWKTGEPITFERINDFSGVKVYITKDNSNEIIAQGTTNSKGIVELESPMLKEGDYTIWVNVSPDKPNKRIKKELMGEVMDTPEFKDNSVFEVTIDSYVPENIFDTRNNFRIKQSAAAYFSYSEITNEAYYASAKPGNDLEIEVYPNKELLNIAPFGTDPKSGVLVKTTIREILTDLVSKLSFGVIQDNKIDVSDNDDLEDGILKYMESDIGGAMRTVDDRTFELKSARARSPAGNIRMTIQEIMKGFIFPGGDDDITTGLLDSMYGGGHYVPGKREFRAAYIFFKKRNGTDYVVIPGLVEYRTPYKYGGEGVVLSPSPASARATKGPGLSGRPFFPFKSPPRPAERPGPSRPKRKPILR